MLSKLPIKNGRMSCLIMENILFSQLSFANASFDVQSFDIFILSFYLLSFYLSTFIFPKLLFLSTFHCSTFCFLERAVVGPKKKSFAEIKKKPFWWILKWLTENFYLLILLTLVYLRFPRVVAVVKATEKVNQE